jgi:hypothetical protein
LGSLKPKAVQNDRKFAPTSGKYTQIESLFCSTFELCNVRRSSCDLDEPLLGVDKKKHDIVNASADVIDEMFLLLKEPVLDVARKVAVSDQTNKVMIEALEVRCGVLYMCERERVCVGMCVCVCVCVPYGPQSGRH